MGRFEKALFLSLGQVAGVCIGMLTPMLLSRWMDIESFGTYRQLLMGLWISGFILHCGMDLGLFYFIKKKPELAPLFSFHASLLTLFVAIIAGTMAITWDVEIATWLNNPALIPLIPWLALLIALAVPAQHLEQLFIIHDKSTHFVAFVSFFSFLQATITIGSIYLWNDLTAVLWGLCAIHLVKLLLLGVYNVQAIKALLHSHFTTKEWLPLLKEQLRYSLPLGVTGSLHAVMQFDRLLISSLYSVATFARYSVGCFNIPVIPGLLDNIHNLMSIEMVAPVKQGKRKEALRIWIHSANRIAFIVIPTFIFFAFYAEDVMVGLFSEKYRDSSTYFQIFLVSFLVFAFDPELVLRAFDRTKVSMHLQILATVTTILFVAIGIWLYGPIGALVGKAASNALDLAIKFGYVKGLFDVRLRDTFPSLQVTKCFFAAIVALLLTTWIPELQIHVQLLATFTTAGLGYLVICRFMGVISHEDLGVIHQRWRQIATRFPRPKRNDPAREALP